MAAFDDEKRKIEVDFFADHHYMTALCHRYVVINCCYYFCSGFVD